MAQRRSPRASGISLVFHCANVWYLFVPCLGVTGCALSSFIFLSVCRHVPRLQEGLMNVLDLCVVAGGVLEVVQ